MTKGKKIGVSLISLIGGVSAVCIGIGVANNINKKPSTDDNTPIVENENIIENNGFANLGNLLSENVVERYSGKPIKNVQIENIKSEKDIITFYTLATINNATQSMINYKVDFNNTDEVYTTFEEFCKKDLKNASKEESNNFWNTISTVVTYENTISVTSISKVENQNISSLSKAVFQDFANESTILDAKTKEKMSASASYYDNIDIIESYFVNRGYDKNTLGYLYDFNGIAFVDGYQAEIHTTISSQELTTDTNELSSIVLKTYNEDKDKFNIVYNTANILNYTMVNSSKTNNKNIDTEIEM